MIPIILLTAIISIVCSIITVNIYSKILIKNIDKMNKDYLNESRKIMINYIKKL